MDATRHSRLSRIGLRVFLGLVAVNALLAIAVVLGGSFDDTGLQVLGTSLTLTLGVMLGLLCTAGQATRHLGPAWLVGIVASVVGTCLWLVGIWGDLDDDVWMVGASFFAGSAAIGMASLLSRATLPERFRWLLGAAYAVISLLLVMTWIAIWGDIGGGFWRIFAVLAILFAALAIVIPVLHAAARREARQRGSESSTAFQYCPGCGLRHRVTIRTATTCDHCGISYTVDSVQTPDAG